MGLRGLDGWTWAQRGLWRHLPRGRALPDGVWWRRHRGVLVLLWLHAPALLVVALVNDVPLRHAALEAGAVAGLAAMATLARAHQRLSTVMASVGLLTCSAVLVHLTDGLTEMHFHYFVMVAIVTLYQDWRPFLVAIGYVVVQHGVVGVLIPESVYNHAEAVEDPWTWAGVHGAFVLAMSVVGVITWRLNEQLLEAANDRGLKLAEAQRLALLGSWEADLVTGEVVWSPQLYELFRVDAPFDPSLERLMERIHPDDREHFTAVTTACLTTGAPISTDYRIIHDNGDVRWVHARGRATVDAVGRVVRVTGTAQDVTDRVRNETLVRESEAELRSTLSLLNATLEATADGILVVDRRGRLTSFNERFVAMWGIPPGTLEVGASQRELARLLDRVVDPDEAELKIRELYANPEAESQDTLEFTDGRVIERRSRPQRVGGEVVGRVWSFRDVTERKRLEDELAHQAFHDPLTALANQALFRDRVEHALVRTARTDALLAVLFLDLDHFKNVNDSLGHVAGDELLVATTDRIRGLLRPVDTAARLGGDEFAVLVEDVGDPAEVHVVAERLLDALRQPFEVAGREVFVGASVGIAFGNADLSTDQLLRNADLAMYRAKSRGRRRIETFLPEMHRAAVERLDLEADLRRAVEREELRLHYQPIVDVATGRIAGVEALLRWQHPVRGLTAPDVFVPLAEDIGVIDEIGLWVLGEACSQVRRWQLEHPRADAPLRVSVNLSPRQLRDDRLVDQVADVLDRAGLAPSCLTLEITEGAMMQDTEVALARLHALKAIGVELSVDDFGTGYSSLSYLQRFPIDELKIDRTFTQRIDQGPEESSLARAIVKLAQTLRLRAVAEGVETDGQLAVLRSLGCEHAQGFLLHRPLEPSAVGALLDRARLVSAGS